METSLLVKLADSINDTSIGIWYRRGDGLLSFHNRQFYRQFGISREPITMDDWVSVIHPEDREPFLNNVNKHLISQKELATSTYRIKTVNNNYITIESTGILYQENGIYKFIGIHKSLSLSTKRTQLSQLTGLRGLEALERELDKSHINKKLYVVNSNRIDSRVKSLGRKIIVNFVNLIENTFYKLNLKFELFIIDESHIVALTDNKSSVDDNLIIKTIIEQTKLDGYIFKEELSLASMESHLIEETYDLYQLITNITQYAQFNEKSKHLRLDKQNHKNIIRQLKIVNSLEFAIENNDFQIAIQPIIDNKTDAVHSVEALARWDLKSVGSIAPGEFIPLIEKLGYASTFGWIIVDKCCDFLSFSKYQNINVNISVSFLKSSNFVTNLLNKTRKRELDPSQLTLEITESIFLDDDALVKNRLLELSSLGFKLSLDDFGSGFSSIMGLFNLPFDQIKIDKSFTKEINANPHLSSLIRFLAKTSKKMSVELVAEGVECEGQLCKLKTYGVSHVQGYFLGRPTLDY